MGGSGWLVGLNDVNRGEMEGKATNGWMDCGWWVLNGMKFTSAFTLSSEANEYCRFCLFVAYDGIYVYSIQCTWWALEGSTDAVTLTMVAGSNDNNDGLITITCRPPTYSGVDIIIPSLSFSFPAPQILLVRATQQFPITFHAPRFVSGMRNEGLDRTAEGEMELIHLKY